MAQELAEDLDHSPRDFAAQIKRWFAQQPARAGHVPPSEHLTHGARENQQLAEIIGQLQHVIDLIALLGGHPHYLPLIATLDGATADTLYLPSAAHTLAGVQVSTDTATILSLSLLDPHQPGGSVQVARIIAPVGVSGWVPLEVSVPPSSCQLALAASVAPAHASVHVLLRPQIPGGYPYAG